MSNVKTWPQWPQQKNIEEHQDKINNPEKYWPDWDDLSEQHQKNQLDKWQKEIDTFQKNIDKNNVRINGVNNGVK